MFAFPDRAGAFFFVNNCGFSVLIRNSDEAVLAFCVPSGFIQETWEYPLYTMRGDRFEFQKKIS